MPGLLLRRSSVGCSANNATTRVFSLGGDTAHLYGCGMVHLLPIKTSAHFSALQRVGGTRKRIAPTCNENDTVDAIINKTADKQLAPTR